MANVDNGNGKKKKKNKKKKTKYNVGNTLLSTSNVNLVGFPLADLILNHNARKDPPTRNNANDFIGKMLTEDANGDLPPGFARIFGWVLSEGNGGACSEVPRRKKENERKQITRPVE